jgi:hypothetical protein
MVSVKAKHKPKLLFIPSVIQVLRSLIWLLLKPKKTKPKKASAKTLAKAWLKHYVRPPLPKNRARTCLKV